jgi:hypothetical protein
MTVRKLRLALLILLVQSLAAFLLFFLTPSEAGSAVILWFSKSRLLLLAGFLILFLAQCAFSFVFLQKPDKLQRLIQRMDAALLAGKLLVPSLIIIAAVFLLGGALFTLILSTPLDYGVYSVLAPTTFPTLKSLVTILFPALLNVWVFLLEALVFLLLRYRSRLRQKETWHNFPLTPLGLAAILLLTGLHWFILIFKLQIFVNLPAWYWDVTGRPFSARDALFTALVLALLGLGFWLFQKKRVWPAVFCLLALALLVQFLPAIVSGEGLPALQERYFSTYHSIYPNLASQTTDSPLEVIRTYEERYGASKFMETKPPGLLFAYLLLDRLVNGPPNPAILSPQALLEQTARVITYLFPLLALAAIVLMLLLAKKYDLPARPASFWLAPYLFVFAPNFMLFGLFADQAVYPAMFLLGSGLIVWLFGKQSLLPAFALGVLLYILTFFAFTMLPLYPLAAFFLLLLFWQSPQRYPLLTQVKAGLSFLAGVAAAYGLGRWALHYDVITRCRHMILTNHNTDFYERIGLTPPEIPEGLGVRLRQIVGAFGLNQVEFAAAIGVGVYLVFVIGAIRLLANALARKTSRGDTLLAAMLLSFLLVNLMGTAQGEVTRLWLFWLPMMAWVVVRELQSWRIPPRWLCLGLCAAQLGTALLTYHFQDFHM